MSQPTQITYDMSSATTTVTEATAETPRERPFFMELLSLIAKVFVTAIALNLVFAAIVLLFASNASADVAEPTDQNPAAAVQPVLSLETSQ